MEIAKEFKNTLERRTKVIYLQNNISINCQTIKQFKEKESFFSLAGSKTEGKSRNKKEAAFLKKRRGLEYLLVYFIDIDKFSSPEENVSGYNEDDTQTSLVVQEHHDLEYLKSRQEAMKNIQKSLEEVMGIFTRISTMVQMQEVMIER